MGAGQLGNLAIIITFGMALLTGVAFLITALGRRNLFSLGVKAFYLQIAFATLALAYLFFLFFTHNFAIKYVYEYSSTDLPFFYLLSALWGGQEGTYLLWLFLSSLFGLFILYRTRQYTTWGMFFHSLVNIFLLIVLFTLSPFKTMDTAQMEGAGLNPLLQDPWMVVHPPVMFFAFAMAGVPFAIALAALIRRDFSSWLKITFPFVAITSFFLIVANVLGGYWAYKTLGWGGYWAWDPVENTSFVPWVISVALLHGMIVERRSGSLRRANLLLSALTFFLIIYGTFLTRSGVLADFSVHSFVDLGINGILVGFLLGFLLLTLIIFFTSRSPEKSGKPLNYNVFSRDFMLFVGTVLFLIVGIVVLFWSSLPLITRYFSAKPAAADIATYNAFAFPLAIIISLFMTLSPVLIGPGFKPANSLMRGLIGLAAAIVIAGGLYLVGAVNLTVGATVLLYIFVMVFYLYGRNLVKHLLTALIIGLVGVAIALVLGVRSFEYLFFIGAALAAAASHISIMISYLAKKRELAGGQISHFGFGLMLIGILASSAFSVNEQVVIPRGEKQEAFNYSIAYSGTAGSIEDQNNQILLSLERNGQKIEARPEFYYSRRSDGMMKKPYIQKKLFYDLYFSPQDIQEMPGTQGLRLKKGESAKVGDYDVKFVGFDMTSHGTSATDMSVGATLEVSYLGKTETVTPRLVSNPNPQQGGQNMISEPVKLFAGQNYDVGIEHVYASEGAVGLMIPGLVKSGPQDRLILDVSRKPGINLLWLGTLIIFVGMAMVIYYRYKR